VVAVGIVQKDEGPEVVVTAVGGQGADCTPTQPAERAFGSFPFPESGTSNFTVSAKAFLSSMTPMLVASFHSGWAQRSVGRRAESQSRKTRRIGSEYDGTSSRSNQNRLLGTFFAAGRALR
jgi:hypothetical protein